MTPLLKKTTGTTTDTNHEIYENSTELANYIWQLKCDNTSFSVNWTIITKVYENPNPLSCRLCLTEKLCIILTLLITKIC